MWKAEANAVERGEEADELRRLYFDARGPSREPTRRGAPVWLLLPAIMLGILLLGPLVRRLVIGTQWAQARAGDRVLGLERGVDSALPVSRSAAQ